MSAGSPRTAASRGGRRSGSEFRAESVAAFVGRNSGRRRDRGRRLCPGWTAAGQSQGGFRLVWSVAPAVQLRTWTASLQPGRRQQEKPRPPVETTSGGYPGASASGIRLTQPLSERQLRLPVPPHPGNPTIPPRKPRFSDAKLSANSPTDVRHTTCGTRPGRGVCGHAPPRFSIKTWRAHAGYTGAACAPR